MPPDLCSEARLVAPRKGAENHPRIPFISNGVVLIDMSSAKPGRKLHPQVQDRSLTVDRASSTCCDCRLTFFFAR